MKGRRTRTIYICLEEGAERPGPDSSDAMNAMDYEKAYNEAIKRAKAAIDIAADKDLVKGVATTIFPELSESEDEKIRKSIIATIEQCPDDFLNPKNRDRMLAWLERQKEQKPVQSEEEKEYIRTLKSRIADFLRGKDKDEVDTTYYQRICDWLDGRHVEQRPAECPSWKPSAEQMMKDADLDEEIIRYQREDMDRDTTVGDVARHFYKLGLKAREKNK